MRQLETELVKESTALSNTSAIASVSEEKIKSLEESQKKFEETLNKYIQKASTVSISNLDFDMIERDGYECIAKTVMTPASLDFRVPPPFKWTVPGNETDKKNTDAYLAYLEKAVADFPKLVALKNIESPYLQTTIGMNAPHLVTGSADLYIIPKMSALACRNQLCAVVELKPNKINSNNLSQAIGYVIAANSLFSTVTKRPSPVGMLTDLVDQWTLIWVGNDNVIYHASFEEKANGTEIPLTRGTALYYLRKHLARYSQMLIAEKSQKRKAEDVDFSWAFGDLEAGRLKKMRLVAEDNMRDLIDDEEELILYDMRKRMENTPLFQIPLPAESHMPYFN